MALLDSDIHMEENTTVAIEGTKYDNFSTLSITLRDNNRRIGRITLYSSTPQQAAFLIALGTFGENMKSFAELVEAE